MLFAGIFSVFFPRFLDSEVSQRASTAPLHVQTVVLLEVAGRGLKSERLGSARPCEEHELGHGEGVESPGRQECYNKAKQSLRERGAVMRRKR